MPHRTRNTRSVLAILFVLALAHASVIAQPRRPNEAVTKNSDAIKTLFRDVVAPASRSTVLVKVDGHEAALGTIVDADGWIITKASEISGKITCRLHDGRELPAKYVGIARDYDVAMLKIEAGKITPIKWGDAGKAQVGEWVAAPGVTPLPVGIGVLSVGRRKIPARSVMLGVALGEEGGEVRVMQVVPGSGAEKAGIHMNDVLLKVDDRKVTSREQFIESIQDRHAGDEVTLVVRRGDKEMDITATLGTRPPASQPSRTDIQNMMGGQLSRRSTGFPAVLQHDTVLRPQDCGGPLVDLDGNVIAINIARAGRTESYAIPSDAIEPLLADLKAGKTPPAASDLLPPPETRPAATVRPGRPR